MKNNISSSYKDYKKSNSVIMSITNYCKIAALYNKFLLGKVLDGYEVFLPCRLGTLSIVGRKQKYRVENGEIKGLAPDWVKTKELWLKNEEARRSKKLLYHMNTHTDGVRYKYIWSKKNVLVTNKTLYSLRMTRGNKRTANALIVQGKAFKTK